jgi:uncharacterized protein
VPSEGVIDAVDGMFSFAAPGLLAAVDLSTPDLVLIALAALVAGGVNALAGGGTFITFPTLTAAGLTSTVANITSTVALAPGHLGGTLAQRADLRGHRRNLWKLVTVGVVGGATGGLLLVITKERVFDVLVPFLILGASLLLAFQERIRGWVARTRSQRNSTTGDLEVWAVAPILLGAVYGGYFGAGLGILLLAVIGIGVHESLVRVNALKQATSLAVNVSAALFFLFSGRVAWAAAAVMAVAALIGGAIGGRFAGKMSEVLLRRIVVTIGLAVATVFFVRLL